MNDSTLGATLRIIPGTYNPLSYEGMHGPFSTTVTPMALNRHGLLLPEQPEPHRTQLAMAVPLHEFYAEVAPALKLVQRMRKLGNICTHSVEVHDGRSMLRRKCCGGLFDTSVPSELIGCSCAGCSRVIVIKNLESECVLTDNNDNIVGCKANGHYTGPLIKEKHNDD